MKRSISVLWILAILTLISANTVLAGDNSSIAVTCTIPAIPGINIPLIEEEAVRTQTNVISQKKAEPQEETKEQSPLLIQQDSQEEESLIIVKTLYSR